MISLCAASPAGGAQLDVRARCRPNPWRAHRFTALGVLGFSLIIALAGWQENVRQSVIVFLALTIMVLYGRSVLATRFRDAQLRHKSIVLSVQLIGLTALLSGTIVGFAAFRFLDLDAMGQALLVGFALGGISLLCLSGMPAVGSPSLPFCYRSRQASRPICSTIRRASAFLSA